MGAEQYNHFDLDAIKRSVNLVDYAKRYTTLTQISRQGEYAGPCPHCGGEDRFHIKIDPNGGRFYCRQCAPQGGDIIDLVQLIHNLDFRAACHHLSTGHSSFPERHEQAPNPTLHHPVQSERPDWQSETYQKSARRTLAATHRLLFHQKGRAGQAYLHSRGLTEETWRLYQLGYGRTHHPLTRQNQEAIFIPWIAPAQKAITAIQHRFIAPDLKRNERYSLKPGSQPLLFGSHLLTPANTLIIVEGEFNCMSLRQSGQQALSIGSEANIRRAEVLTHLLPLIEPYRTVLIWLDDQEQGRELAERLQQQQPVRKEKIRLLAQTQDANDLLQAGQLARLLHDSLA